LRRRADATPTARNESAVRPHPDREAPSTRWLRALELLILAGAAAIPLFVSLQGHDVFRQPKQLLLYAVVLAATAMLLSGLALGRIAVDDAARRVLRIPLWIAAAGLAWAALAGLLSAKRALALDALVWGSAATLLVLVAAFALRHSSPHRLLLAVLAPMVVNATVVLLQASRIWNPWVFPERTPVRLHKNALLGNPDDVGIYLAIGTIVALVAALHFRALRVLFCAIALFLFIATMVTETRTAAIALGAAIVVLAMLRSVRIGIALVLVMTLLGGLGTFTYEPVRDRVAHTWRALTRGEWDAALSGRLTAFAAAWQMFLDHPVTGIGPGAFKYHYMSYRERAENEYTSIPLIRGRRAVNFGETHNDHLQILAEVGLPGYAAVAAGLLYVASRGLRRRTAAASVRAAFARDLAPTATTLAAVMMLAQFPLQLAAPAATLAMLGAACIAWSEDEDA
jgi:O-antigen ligase